MSIKNPIWMGLSLLLSAVALQANDKTIDTLPALDETLTKILQDKHVASVSYAIFDANGIIHQNAIGVRDRAQQLPATEKTLYRAGSITKTLTAMAIMQLIEQGRFDLQTPVLSLLPDLPIVNPYPDSPVRVVHLLEHTAGFDDMHFKGMYRDNELLTAHATALQVDPDPLQVRWQPGTMHSYSNPGYGVLGALIEQVSGQRWEDYVQANLLQPLGMHDSVLTIADAMQREHALPYSDKETAEPFSAIYLRAAGVLWSTPSDLAKLARFLYTDGATVPGLLMVKSLRQMKQPHSTMAARHGLEYGYNLGTYHSVRRQQHFIGHNGGITGFFASFLFKPQSGVGMAVMVNSDQAGYAVIDPIADYVQHIDPLTPEPLTTVTPNTDINGWYRAANSRNELMRLPEWLLAVIRVESDDKGFMIAPLVNQNERFVVGADERVASEKSPVWTGQIIRDNGVVTGISVDSQYLQRVNTFYAIAPPAFFILAILGLLSSPFGRRRAMKSRWMRRWPMWSALSFVVFVGLLFNLSLQTVAQVNVTTLGIFVASLLLPISAVGGLVTLWLNWSNETAKVAKWRSAIGIVSASYIAVLFASFHLFGLMLWAW